MSKSPKLKKVKLPAEKKFFTDARKLTTRIIFGLIMVVVLVVATIFAIMFLIEHFVHITEDDNLYLWVFVAVSLGVGVLVGTILSVMYSRLIKRVTKPYIDVIQRVAEGDFSATVQEDGLLLKHTNFSDNFNKMVRRLSSVETLRENFISDFSHEFKTPIVSIEGFAKLLKDPSLTDEERNEYLDIIISESARLVNLSQNVLSLTRLNDQQVQKEVFLLDEQLRQSVLLFDKALEERNIQVDLNMETIRLNSSQKLLSQVWVNLISNAIKFSNDGGSIVITASIVEDNAVVVLQDFGCGMNEETLENIYNKFFQGDKSRSVEGNGLGLPIVQKILKLVGGNIAVTSQVDKGSTFTVTLPLDC